LERVHLPGNLPNAGSLFAAFDLFVMTSRTEGTPIVLLEAMAAGVPIVATEVGGIPELLGGTGKLVPPESPAVVASAIRSVIQNQDQAISLARAGRARLEREFALAPWIEAYEALYVSLADRHSRLARQNGSH
jgi:glycosyltransferase involved in cell wall biosynthesis